MKGMRMGMLLLISGFCSFSCAFEFHFVNIFKNYSDAQSFCREKYADLATVANVSAALSLTALVEGRAVRTWIGLHSADEPTWHWSLQNQQLTFLNWDEGEPNGMAAESCGAMNSEGRWFESDCTTKRGFVCEENETHPHIFVAEKMTWRRSQDHCRGLSSELVSIQSSGENRIVQTGHADTSVWVGLFKDDWQWSDGSSSSYRYWRRNRPKGVHRCAVAVLTDDGHWSDLRCDINRRFICQGARTLSPTLPPPANQTAATADPILTALTTNVENTTLQSSTVSATTTSPTLSSAPPGNLVLIQRNLSWVEAWAYCGAHHSGLASVHSQELQERVVRAATGATSPRVWLGLRYSCSLQLWFWVEWGDGCYQNWAPGHGTGREYNCGVAGALDATGGWQWVGLSGTERLNFLCATCTEHRP